MPNKGSTGNKFFTMEMTPKSKRSVLKKFARLEKWLPEVSMDAMILTGEQIATKTDDSLRNANFIETTDNLRASYHVEAPGYKGLIDQALKPETLVGGTEQFSEQPKANQVFVGSPVVYAWWIETGENRTRGIRRKTTAGLHAFINAYIMFKGKLLKTLKKKVSKQIGIV